MPKINEHFVTAMSKYGIKAKELAELVGISAQQITEFRRGRSWVSQETFESILENMDHLSPGSKRYFCSLMANQEISRTDNKQILIDMIENANAEEIETALLAIGRKWAATSKQNQLPTYAEVS
ncbi:MAG: helix-turn-helix domain-containing protein [Aphanizomenon sp.]|jgi:transcriptional regulator with XRE-family HTH domain